MNVKELRKILSELPDDMPVIVAKDAAMNAHSPLDDIEHENLGYVADTTWSGEVMFLQLTDSLRSGGYDDLDVDPDATPCVVLYPVD